MQVTPLELPGVLLVAPRVFRDARGLFFESWHRARYAAAGIPEEFVQDNVSVSAAGVLRGLHLQHPRGQGKLVSVVAGAVFDVAVDVREGSPTFGRWVGARLDAERREQLYIPPGFAHGFQVLSEQAVFVYKCSAVYNPTAELTVAWDDPDLSIAWPRPDPAVSEKDARGVRLRDLAGRGRLPTA